MLDARDFTLTEAALPAVVRFTRARAGGAAARLRALIGLVRLLRRRLRHRRDMRALALFEPDSVLADVGISRERAWREARKPLWRP